MPENIPAFGSVQTECCNETRTTPYCPMCGKQLKADKPIHGLLAHVRRHVKQLKGELEKLEARDYSGYPDRKRILLSRARKASERWQAWETELVELIGTETPKDEK